MSYSEKDILKLLNIQAKTLKRVDSLLRDSLEEVAYQKQFIARLYRELKKDAAQEQEQENIAISEGEVLPTNVLMFPSDET